MYVYRWLAAGGVGCVCACVIVGEGACESGGARVSPGGGGQAAHVEQQQQHFVCVAECKRGRGVRGRVCEGCVRGVRQGV